MRYSAAIFDLDGTLLDTLDDLADAMNTVLGQLGFPVHPVDSYRYFVGTGLGNLAAKAVPDGTPADLVATIPSLMKDVYSTNWAAKTKPYPGILAMLESFRSRNIPLAILSNKPDDFTKSMAKHFFPAGTFQVVRGMTADVPRKPDPAGAFIITEQLRVRPGDCLYFGDTDTDMQTGRAAGMATIGVSWGFRPVAELEAAGAMRIINHPEEAPGLLEEIV